MNTLTTTTSRSPRRVAVQRALATLTGIVLAVTSLLSAPSAASAWSTSSTGSAGSVGVPYTDLIYNSNDLRDYVRINGRTIGEAPYYAKYDQKVCITSTLWRVQTTPNSYGVPYWYAQEQSTRCGTIAAAATSVWDGGNTFATFPLWVHRVTVDVTWSVNGTTVATRRVDYNQAADYRLYSASVTTGTTTWGGGFFFMFNF